MSDATAKPGRAEKTAAAGRKREGRSLRLRLVRSGICAPRDQKATLAGLGFRRVGQEIVRSDDPAVRGMIHKVRHLVEIVKD